MNIKKLTLALLTALSLTANAANEKETVAQVTDAISLTTDVDYIITGTTPFATTGSVNIENTEHAVIIIKKVKPSKVIATLMSHIYIKGEPAVNGTNCQVKMYDRGAIIFPYEKAFRPLTCYTEENFGGEACNNYTEGHSGGFMKSLTDATLNNNFRSFKLKRGYMVTFALGTGGWGYSRVFIADQEDLEMNLPANMIGRVSSYRIFKWHNAHKAGLASDGRAAANAAVGSCWCYDWAQGNSSLLPDVEWVPNHIYEDWPSPSTCGSVDGSCHMKTNNEPGNSADDHPQSVEDVLNNWQNLMRTGMRLCSESSHDGSWNHLREFIKQIDARGWRCDLLDLHCYWPAGSFGDFKNYYNDYGGRPIWISEWVWGASWNNNGAFAVSNRSDFTGNQNNTYNGTKPILEKLNASKYVERYAYWNSEANCSKIYLDGKLSKLGEYYANMDEGLGYDASIQKVPTVVYNTPTNLVGTYSNAKQELTLTWDDANGDMLDSVVVQCKAAGTVIYKWAANVPLKDVNSKKGASYTFKISPDEGTSYYRIAAYPIGNKTPKTSNEVVVTVSKGMGGDYYQIGKLNIANTEPITTDFSTSFSTTPAVFMGVMSNKNTTLFPGNLLTSVQKSRFTYQINPWKNQSNGTTELKNPEDIAFLAIQDTTSYAWGNMSCEVGSAKIQMKDTVQVEFATPFAEGVTPIVITEFRNPTLKTNPMTIRIWDVTNKGFKAISMYEEAVGTVATTLQNMVYMAVTPGFEYIDESKGIMIAAGIGDVAYGTGSRLNSFELEGDTLHFKDPCIYGGLQTYNYHSASVLRRASDAKDGEFTIGTRIKRQIDGTSTTTDKNTADFADIFGWVIIAKTSEGSSMPTAIESIIPSTPSVSGTFDLTGRRITASVKGQMYIKNGKKYLAK